MKVTVIGSGYVGLVTGACLAEVGHDVMCLDIDHHKIGQLQQGIIPIHEPRLDQLITRNQDAGRLSFTTDCIAAAQHGDLQFIAVGTPPDEDGSADLRYVLAAARNIALHMNRLTVVIDKSTVPVGTADKVTATISATLTERGESIPFTVVSNPEFLKEGAAIDDFMHPDRIVIGVDTRTSMGEMAVLWLKNLYAPFQRDHERMIWMDVRSAELTKYAANAMLATRISFMNEMACVAETLGADIELIRKGIGSDPRIGYDFLYAGCGYGGSCFPKDVQALIHTGQQAQHPMHILNAVETVNRQQKNILVDKVVQQFGQDLSGKSFAIWGLAFKPETDDMREAPSRVIIRQLIERGATVRAYDPIAMKEAQRVLQIDMGDAAMPRITLIEKMYATLQDCDALLIVTEWLTFRTPDFSKISQRLKPNPQGMRMIFDGRNLYDSLSMRQHRIAYFPIGRQQGVQDITPQYLGMAL